MPPGFFGYSAEISMKTGGKKPYHSEKRRKGGCFLINQPACIAFAAEVSQVFFLSILFRIRIRIYFKDKIWAASKCSIADFSYAARQGDGGQ